LYLHFKSQYPIFIIIYTLFYFREHGIDIERSNFKAAESLGSAMALNRFRHPWLKEEWRHRYN